MVTRRDRMEIVTEIVIFRIRKKVVLIFYINIFMCVHFARINTPSRAIKIAPTESNTLQTVHIVTHTEKNRPYIYVRSR